MNNGRRKTNFKEILTAFYAYLRRPKTVFDLKDRLRALLLFIIIVYVLQKVAQFFAEL